MSDSRVTVEQRAGGVAVLRIDRPKMNALSTALTAEIGAAVEGLVAKPPSALVVTGGPRIFAAGADIEELGGGASSARSVAEGFRRALDGLAAFPRVTIAAINGYALGGGLELALACDFRVASATAKLGLPEIMLGVIPGGGGTQRLARLIGASRAKELVLSGRHVRAEEAQLLGIVDRVVEAEAQGASEVIVDRVVEVEAQGASEVIVDRVVEAEAQGASEVIVDRVVEVEAQGASEVIVDRVVEVEAQGASEVDGDPVLDAACRWAAEFARGALVAQSLAKRAIDRGLELDLSDGLDLERDLFVKVFSTEDSSIGIRSFIERGPGKAEFTGR